MQEKDCILVCSTIHALDSVGNCEKGVVHDTKTKTKQTLWKLRTCGR